MHLKCLDFSNWGLILRNANWTFITKYSSFSWKVKSKVKHTRFIWFLKRTRKAMNYVDRWRWFIRIWFEKYHETSQCKLKVWWVSSLCLLDKKSGARRVLGHDWNIYWCHWFCYFGWCGKGIPDRIFLTRLKLVANVIGILLLTIGT